MAFPKEIQRKIAKEAEAVTKRDQLKAKKVKTSEPEPEPEPED